MERYADLVWALTEMRPASSPGLGSCASSVQMPFPCPLKLWSPLGVRCSYLLSPAEGSEDMSISG